MKKAFSELRQAVYAALETYSNVHRGSGHNSMVTTALFEQARENVLDYLGLDKKKYIVIFCTQYRAAKLKTLLKPESYQCISSGDIGLPLGVWAMAVMKNKLPKGVPFHTGGGSTRLVSSDWIIWAKAPDKFEAGTPAIMNIIAFAKALLLIKHYGINCFKDTTSEKITVNEILFHDAFEQSTGRELLNELRKTLIGRNISVPTLEGSKAFINLDNAASTPTFEPIFDAVCQAWQQPQHKHQQIINEVKSICGKTLDAKPAEYDMLFTSNTTEAINITAVSLKNEFSNDDFESVVLNTLMEHNSNDLPWRMIPNFSLLRINVDNDGLIDLNELEKILNDYNQQCLHGKKRIRLFAVSGASNVLGVYNDLAEISRIVHKYGACLLVDAAQLVAHRKVDIESLGIDYFVFSAHKVYAPFGSGLLIAKKGALSFTTSELELINRSGEENIGGIAAMGKALMLLNLIGFDLIQQQEQALTIRMLQGLSQIKALTIYGIKDINSPRFSQKGGVVLIALKGAYPNVIAKKLAEQGAIGVRYGCHCSHLIIKRLLKLPPMLERFQAVIVTVFPKLSLPGLCRISLGIENTEEEVDKLIQQIRKIAKQPY